MSKKQSIKSIIDGRDMECGEFEYDWQEFVLKRINTTNKESFREIDAILEQISNSELVDSAEVDIIDRELRASYINNNRIFFGWNKKVLTLGK